jgi:hypothetical protein
MVVKAINKYYFICCKNSIKKAILQLNRAKICSAERISEGENAAVSTESETTSLDNTDTEYDFDGPQIDQLIQKIDKLENSKSQQKNRRNHVRRSLEEFEDNRRMRQMLGDI